MVLGILSGKYIFEEPLQHYWAEKHAADAAVMETAPVTSPSAVRMNNDGGSANSKQ